MTTTSHNRLGPNRAAKRFNPIKRRPTLTIDLKNTDRFFRELTEPTCEGLPTTFLIRVSAMKRGKKTTTLTLVTTKG